MAGEIERISALMDITPAELRGRLRDWTDDDWAAEVARQEGTPVTDASRLTPGTD